MIVFGVTASAIRTYTVTSYTAYKTRERIPSSSHREGSPSKLFQ